MASSEKASREKDVPKFFRVAVWSVAVISAGAFAFIVGLLAYNVASSPISANPANGATCPSGTLQYAVNNYPFTKSNPAKAGDHQRYYNKWGGDPNWRCSLLCIPVPNPNESQFTNENLGTARTYLQKKCDAGIVTNKNEFDALTGSSMLNTVILDSLKLDCQGPNSRDYNPPIYCEGTDKSIAREDTSYTPPSPTPEPTQTKTAASSGPPTSAQPPQENLEVQTSAGKKISDARKANSATFKNLQKCWEDMGRNLAAHGFNNETAKPFLNSNNLFGDLVKLHANYYKPLLDSQYWRTSEEKKAKAGFTLCQSLSQKMSKALEKTTGELSPETSQKTQQSTKPIIKTVRIGNLQGKKITKPKYWNIDSGLSESGKVCVIVISGLSKKMAGICTSITNGNYNQILLKVPADFEAFGQNSGDSVMLYAYDKGKLLTFERTKFNLSIYNAWATPGGLNDGNLAIGYSPNLEQFKKGDYSSYERVVIFAQNAALNKTFEISLSSIGL